MITNNFLEGMAAADSPAAPMARPTTRITRGNRLSPNTAYGTSTTYGYEPNPGNVWTTTATRGDRNPERRSPDPPRPDLLRARTRPSTLVTTSRAERSLRCDVELGLVCASGVVWRLVPTTSSDAPAPAYVCMAGIDWWYSSHAHSELQLLRRVARTRRVLFVNSIGLRMPLPGRSTQPWRRVTRKIAQRAPVPEPADPRPARLHRAEPHRAPALRHSPPAEWWPARWCGPSCG